MMAFPSVFGGLTTLQLLVGCRSVEVIGCDALTILL